MIIFSLPWNHLWQNQITADWLLYWWKMRHISFQEMCDNTIWFLNAKRFPVEVNTADICGSHKMKVRFVCCSLQVFDEVVGACCIMSQDSWAKRSVLNIFVWTYFQLVFCCNKRLTTMFSNFIREYLPLRPYQALIDFDKSSYILHYD